MHRHATHEDNAALRRIAWALDRLTHVRADTSADPSAELSLPALTSKSDKNGEELGRPQTNPQPTDTTSHTIASVQQAVETSLTQFFDMVLVPLAYKFDRNPDAWRLINEFAAERHFVYVVDGANVDDALHSNDQQIAQSLAAFCAQSKGQFVLYVAAVLCSQNGRDRVFSDHNGGDTERDNDVRVTLKAPWVKFGETEVEAFAYPPIVLREGHLVAPLSRLEALPLHAASTDVNALDWNILHTLYGDHRNARYATVRALVVQPTSIELSQIAKLPTLAVIAKLRKILPESRDDALQYTRRVIYYRPRWSVHYADKEEFAAFVTIIAELNDRPIFNALLQTLDLHVVDDSGALRAATAHFGWDDCVETVRHCLLSTPTLRGRVHLMLSVIGRPNDSTSFLPAPFDHLLDALLSLAPWTAVQVNPSKKVRSWEYHNPGVGDFRRLLMLANKSSPEKLLQVVSVIEVQQMVRLVAMALVQLVRQSPDSASLQSALLHVWRLYKPMLATLLNEPYTHVSIPEHCSKCSELQSFVSSTAVETTVRYTNASERDHITAVLATYAHRPAVVETQSYERLPALRLVKIPSCTFDSLLDHAQWREKNILELLASRVEGGGGNRAL